MDQNQKATILPGDSGPERRDNFLYIERYPVVGEVKFLTNTVRDLYQRWCDTGPEMEKWSDLNLDSEIEFKPNYYLIKVVEEGEFLYQRNGREIDRLVGAFLRGKKFSYEDELPENRTLARYFQEIVDDHLCYRCCGDLVTLDGLRPFESVDCPLVDDKGDVIATIGALSLTN